MIKEVIVVEGKDDVAAVKKAVDAEMIAVGGFGINANPTPAPAPTIPRVSVDKVSLPAVVQGPSLSLQSFVNGRALMSMQVLSGRIICLKIKLTLAFLLNHLRILLLPEEPLSMPFLSANGIVNAGKIASPRVAA